MKKLAHCGVIISGLLFALGCQGGADANKAAEPATTAAKKAETPPKAKKTAEPTKPAADEAKKADDLDLSDPKKSIATQLELLKAGDADKLKACFTDRLKERITPELVKKAQEQAAKMTLDELVGETQEGEFEGKKTTKIKMKNGRTLTTLILTDGKWLADTLWFK